MEKLFRSLIVISNSAYVLWFFQPYYATNLYTETMREVLEADGYSGVDILLKYSIEIGWVFLALFLLSAIGLFLYIKIARTLFTVLCLSSFVIPLFYGISVQSHIDVVLNNITYMADSIVLYMSYFSSVAVKFKAHNK